MDHNSESRSCPKVTIITATHNVADTLRTCLESVASQTYENKEHIIVDNLSSDGTVGIIKEYAPRYPHIRWVSEHDDGIYDAMNKGIKMASGEWVYFLGSDDSLSENTILENIIAETDGQQIDVFQGDVLIDRDGKEVVCSGERATLARLIIDGNLCHQSMLVKRRLFDRFGYFDTKYKARADYALNLRVFSDLSVVRKYLPIAIARYNVHGFSATHIDRAFAEDSRQMLKTLLPREHVDAYNRIIELKDELKQKNLEMAAMKASKVWKTWEKCHALKQRLLKKITVRPLRVIMW